MGDPLNYTPGLRDLQNAANARGESGPLDKSDMREAHQLGFAEGYAAGLEAAAESLGALRWCACCREPPHISLNEARDTIRALGSVIAPGESDG